MCVAGPAGIGKTRLGEEAAAIARGRGVDVVSVFCESHTSDVPFVVVARLLRDAARITELGDEAARAQVRAVLSDASDDDVLLLFDLMGIRDPDTPPPTIHADARRRRLVALFSTVSLARTRPVLYVIEDVHWIDEVSESMLAEFLAVIPQTPSLMLISYRPYYRGVLANVQGAQTISLTPLTNAETAELLDELLGTDQSIAGIKALLPNGPGGIRSSRRRWCASSPSAQCLGRPWRFHLRHRSSRGHRPCHLQATIAARIDRLDPDSKRTLNAAAVIGSRFTPDLLAAVGNVPAVDALLAAALIDQVRFTPTAEFAFHHPLIRAVAYESQLRADRARMHGRLAAAIEAHEPEGADQNAALIAEHLSAAGDIRGASPGTCGLLHGRGTATSPRRA